MWNMNPILVLLDGKVYWLLFMIQLTVSICMFVGIVLNIYNRCHTLLTLKWHKENDSNFAYRACLLWDLSFDLPKWDQVHEDLFLLVQISAGRTINKGRNRSLLWLICATDHMKKQISAINRPGPVAIIFLMRHYLGFNTFAAHCKSVVKLFSVLLCPNIVILTTFLFLE